MESVANAREEAMFGLFKKSDKADKPKVDAAEMERQEREARMKDTAEKMRDAVQMEKGEEEGDKPGK
jgi:hypothetical protein